VPGSGIIFTGEKRLIRRVTGDVISVPLVEVNLTSPLCTGTYLYGYVSTLPDGIALLIGNDLCYNQSVADVTVVTRSLTAAENAKTDQLATKFLPERYGRENIS